MLTITEVANGYLRATFDNPPLNLLDPDVFADLRLLLDRMSTDETLKVVVFDSAVEGWFIGHLDTTVTVEVELGHRGGFPGSIRIDMRARVPEITPEQFSALAETAKTGCLISRLLSVEPALTAELISS